MPSEIEFTDKQLFTMKMLAIVPLAFVTVFLLIALFLASRPGDGSATSKDWEALSLVTNIVLGLTVVFNSVSPFAQKLVVRIVLRIRNTTEAPFEAVYKGMMFPHALSAAPAVLGIFFILRGASLGDMPSYLWLNLIPVAIFYVVVISTFPTRERAERWLSKLTT